MDGFEQVVGFDAFAGGEVCDGAGDFQDAVVGACGERELLHRLLEQVAEGRIERDMRADLRVRHARVGGGAGALVALELAVARGLHAGGERGGILAGGGVA
ncbi:MAG: hypothetical protein RIQ79_325 [Verrucomicrobiota bacterium]